MRFEEVYESWTKKRLTQEEAAELLGVCARTFRRYIDRYEDDGLDGLMDHRMDQVSQLRVPVDEVPLQRGACLWPTTATSSSPSRRLTMTGLRMWCSVQWNSWDVWRRWRPGLG